jgi:hypothetical protein
MAGRFRSYWLPWLLGRLIFGLSAVLLVLVLLAPLLDNGMPQPEGWSRLLALFARDATLRRTAVASAIGLLVTAYIFFRPAEPLPPPQRQPKPPPPSGVAGA